MPFRKYQHTEKDEVLSPEQHKKVENHLHRHGATSVNDLSAEEREGIEIDGSDEPCNL